MNDVLEYIKENSIGKFLENESLKKFTTYKVGGIVPIIVYPKDEKKLIMLIRYLKNTNIKYMVLGNGSNVLFSDNPYDGVIIKLDEFNQVEFQDNFVTAGAGINLIRLSNMCIKRGLSGLEFATGIPGSIGGAVFMNAGAYKSDMGYLVRTVRVLTPDLNIINMANREMKFHYRSSFLQQNKDYICLAVKLKLKPGDKSIMMDLVNDRRDRRMSSQPLEYPSAGSVFRNPDVDTAAGKLIEDLGIKGLVRGGAQISDKHANFIINIGNAKSSDIKELIEFTKLSVKEKYNIDLKVEQEFVNWE